jgi:hypothetical protein
VEIKFGVVLDAKLGGILAGANTGVHLDVTLRWNGSALPDEPEGGGSGGDGSEGGDPEGGDPGEETPADTP